MKSVLLYLIYVVLCLCLWQWSDHNDAVRLQQQAQILATIEANHTADTSDFVQKWQSAHPHPNAEVVSSLTLLAARIKNDPSSAKSFEAGIKPEVTFVQSISSLLAASKGNKEYWGIAALASLLITALFLHLMHQSAREER
jgi:hypothetical protein